MTESTGVDEAGAERAADAIEARLRGKPWFTTAGTGRGERGWSVFLLLSRESPP